jgi:hypothetical protein
VSHVRCPMPTAGNIRAVFACYAQTRMSGISGIGVWRRIVCGLTLLLFTLQIAVPFASAATSGGVMQCCRRAHAKDCCPRSRNQSNGPALNGQKRCSQDCAAAPAVTRVIALSPSPSASSVPGIEVRVCAIGENFTRRATPISSDSFQRPPPAL